VFLFWQNFPFWRTERKKEKKAIVTMTGLSMAFFIFGKKEWHIRDIRKVKKRQHQFLSSVIHRVR
jgi:hypothetical protein